MLFYPSDATVPSGLRTAAFVLQPLSPVHNPLDYEAVMATQARLRLYGKGEWPHPNFTPEENLLDLEGHAADFQAHTGFTYTVLAPTETRCLGCVYVYPLERALHRLGADPDSVAQLGDYAAEVWFWTRPDNVPPDLEHRLLSAIRPWLGTDFAFSRVVFRTSSNDTFQTSLLQEAGLQLVWSHPHGDGQALHFA